MSIKMSEALRKALMGRHQGQPPSAMDVYAAQVAEYTARVQNQVALDSIIRSEAMAKSHAPKVLFTILQVGNGYMAQIGPNGILGTVVGVELSECCSAAQSAVAQLVIEEDTDQPMSEIAQSLQMHTQKFRHTDGIIDKSARLPPLAGALLKWFKP